jgi:hypothetical protein
VKRLGVDHSIPMHVTAVDWTMSSVVDEDTPFLDV